MSKFDEALEWFRYHEKRMRLSADNDPNELATAYPHYLLALETLTQAADIERGDKVVVDRREADLQADLMASVSRELWSEILHRHYTDEEIEAEAEPVKKIIDNLITASEGK